MNKTKSMQEIVQKAAEKTRKYMADNKADRQKLYECLYKQEPIKPNYKKCNLAFCRYNIDGECVNDKAREECAEVSRKVLCINEENIQKD